jgi:hypothetical protein
MTMNKSEILELLKELEQITIIGEPSIAQWDTLHLYRYRKIAWKPYFAL